MGGASFHKSLRVESIKPNRLKVDVDLGGKEIRGGSRTAETRTLKRAKNELRLHAGKGNGRDRSRQEQCRAEHHDPLTRACINHTSRYYARDSCEKRELED